MRMLLATGLFYTLLISTGPPVDEHAFTDVSTDACVARCNMEYNDCVEDYAKWVCKSSMRNCLSNCEREERERERRRRRNLQRIGF